MDDPARCFTFYSYKGGSGRTTVLLNTVNHLIDELGASPEKPILLVDADLESAGLTYYFKCNGKFRGKFNTGEVLSDFSSTFSKENTPVIFNEADESRSIIPCKESPVWKKLIEMDERDTSTVKYTDVFADVCLPGKYFALFINILNHWINNDEYRTPDGITLSQLKDKFRDINREESDLDKRSKIKSEMLKEFLPARSFVDVSEYFSSDVRNVAPDTVRFLGTDVSYEARVMRSDAAVDSLVQVCSDHGFCAVVFDSGSGTQTSAYVLHSKSDVIVYCMRPTLQFIDGTEDNLFRFLPILAERQEDKLSNDQKVIILFPNAVPESDGNSPLRMDSFRRIAEITEKYGDIVDPSFSTYESCMHEVPLFKWREAILGCKDPRDNFDDSPEVRKIMESYATASLQNDVQVHAEVFRSLAKRLLHNS